MPALPSLFPSVGCARPSHRSDPLLRCTRIKSTMSEAKSICITELRKSREPGVLRRTVKIWTGRCLRALRIFLSSSLLFSSFSSSSSISASFSLKEYFVQLEFPPEISANDERDWISRGIRDKSKLVKEMEL